MSAILQDTEDICSSILGKLESMPANMSADQVEDVTTKIEAIKKSVSTSKKKVMVRTEKGKEFSLKAKTLALELEDALTKIPNKSPESVLTTVNLLQKEVNKIETYWKSYEAAIT